MSDEITVNLNYVVQTFTTLFGLFVAWRAYRSAKKEGSSFLLPPLGWFFAGVVASISGSTILIFVAVFWLTQDSQKKKEPNQPVQRNASTGSVSNFESPARRG